MIEDEWPIQAESGKASSKARKQIGDLFRSFGNGTITADMKKEFPLSCNVVMQAITDVGGATDSLRSSRLGSVARIGSLGSSSPKPDDGGPFHWTQSCGAKFWQYPFEK